MLDLSSGLGQLPFSALTGRYYISEAVLYLSVLFYLSQFSLPLFFPLISRKDYAVLLLSCLWVGFVFLLATLSFFFSTYFSWDGNYFFCLLSVSFCPACPFLIFLRLSDSPSFFFSFLRPRGVKLCAQTPVSQRMHLPRDGGAVQ